MIVLGYTITHSESYTNSSRSFRKLIQWRSLLTNRATSWKIAGSIPDGAIEILHCLLPSGRTMALESTDMSPERKMLTHNTLVTGANYGPKIDN
jgi:hypothetical protein